MKKILAISIIAIPLFGCASTPYEIIHKQVENKIKSGQVCFDSEMNMSVDLMKLGDYRNGKYKVVKINSALSSIVDLDTGSAVTVNFKKKESVADDSTNLVSKYYQGRYYIGYVSNDKWTCSDMIPSYVRGSAYKSDTTKYIDWIKSSDLKQYIKNNEANRKKI